MIHLALTDSGLVLAQFITSADAAEFCRTHSACHVPFNAARHAPPAVGSLYRA
jgi:hypothetical protein